MQVHRVFLIVSSERDISFFFFLSFILSRYFCTSKTLQQLHSHWGLFLQLFVLERHIWMLLEMGTCKAAL